MIVRLPNGIMMVQIDREVIRVGLRAYVLIKAHDSIDQDHFIKSVTDLERMPEVDFADVVIGSSDVVVMAECPISVDAFVKKIAALNWVSKLDVLRIVGMYERQRASNKHLQKALRHSGV